MTADKDYDGKDFMQALRQRWVTPHKAAKTTDDIGEHLIRIEPQYCLVRQSERAVTETKEADAAKLRQPGP